MTEQLFANKRVLVTGGSRGIGRATVRLFAQRGAQVCFTYHQNEREAQATLAQLPGSAHQPFQVDMADKHAVRTTVEAAAIAMNGLDILVNNAGIFLPHAIDELPFGEWMATWQRTLDVNLTGPAAACHAAVPYLKNSSDGRIINVGSRGAFRGEAGQPGYGAAKAGLHALSQSLAVGLGSHGIKVHAVAPGFVETAMARPHLQGAAGEAVKQQSPLARVATVEDVAQAIVFLASPAAEFTTGCILDINGASYLRT